MTVGTLPGYVLFVMVCMVLMAIAGYENYYIPKKQKLDLEYIKKKPTRIEEFDYDFEPDRHIGEMIFLMLSFAISAVTLFWYFYTEIDDVVIDQIKKFSLSGLVLRAGGVFVFLILALFIAALFGQELAKKEIDDYYRQHGVIKIDEKILDEYESYKTQQ